MLSKIIRMPYTGRHILPKQNLYFSFKFLLQLIKQHYTSYHKTDHHRYPVYFLSITVATDQLDVNVDPNKTTVLLHHKVGDTDFFMVTDIPYLLMAEFYAIGGKLMSLLCHINQ